MKPKGALEAARRAGIAGRFFIIPHALERQKQRTVTRFDLKNALMTSTRSRYQQDKDRWRLEGGVDLDGDDLTVIVAFDPALIVITVF